MSKLIKILENNPANVLIYNAMCVNLGDDDLLSKFKLNAEGDDTIAEIKIYINGIEIDFESAFKDAIQELVNNYNKNVKEKAIDIITNSTLADLHYELQNAEYKIREQLDKIIIDK